MSMPNHLASRAELSWRLSAAARRRRRAFFLLPMARLMVAGASGPNRTFSAYAAILTEPRYRATLINTVLLAAATTVVTLASPPSRASFCSAIVFPAARADGDADLSAAFPGVVVGFLIILLAGRQGLIGEVTTV